MIECCDNCRFAYRTVSNKMECHRRAPEPYTAWLFRLGEIVRDIAWNYRIINNIKTDEKDLVDREITDDVTEGPDYACWPVVERDDWCGEYAARGDAPMREWTNIDEEKPDE